MTSPAATSLLWDLAKGEANRHPKALREQPNGQRAAVALSILEQLAQLEARLMSVEGLDRVRKELFASLNDEFPAVWP